MFCHNVGSQRQFIHLLMALTKEEGQTSQGYRQGCTLQYQREMLTEETSYDGVLELTEDNMLHHGKEQMHCLSGPLCARKDKF